MTDQLTPETQAECIGGPHDGQFKVAYRPPPPVDQYIGGYERKEWSGFYFLDREVAPWIFRWVPNRD